MRDDADRLRDVLEAIDRIQKYTPTGRDAFESDELIQVWVVHHIQIIGEALRRISDSLRNGHPEIPWTQIIAMRNILTHDYLGINMSEVWSTVEQDLPDLKGKIESSLHDLEGKP